MHQLPRYTISLAGGLFLALMLLWGMQRLISQESPELKVSRDSPVIEFVRLKRDSDTRIKERMRPEEPPPKQPKPPQAPKLEVEAAKPDPLVPDILMPDANLRPSFDGPYIGPVMQGVMDRDFIAVSRTPPQYPYRAERKRIEGWVKVSFLITETGVVQDVVLIDAEPENVFDHAATRAVYKWKFKPRIVDGKPVAVRAEQIISFRLDGK